MQEFHNARLDLIHECVSLSGLGRDMCSAEGHTGSTTNKSHLNMMSRGSTGMIDDSSDWD